MNKKTIICVVGPSGSGKTTAVEFASKALGIPVLRSYTTRPMRDGEVDGIDHIFVTESEMPKRKDMLAYTNFGGNHYWTSVDQLGHVDVVLYVIDEVGLEEMRSRFEGKFNIFSVYISPSKELMDKVDVNRFLRDRDRLKLPMESHDSIVYNNGSLEFFLFMFTKTIYAL